MTKYSLVAALALVTLNTACTVSTSSSPKVPKFKQPEVTLPKNPDGTLKISPDKETDKKLAEILNQATPMEGTVIGFAKVDGKAEVLSETPTKSGGVECVTNASPTALKYNFEKEVDIAYKTSDGKRVSIRIEDPDLGAPLYAFTDSVQANGYNGPNEKKSFPVKPGTATVWMTAYNDFPLAEKADCTLEATPTKVKYRYDGVADQIIPGVAVSVSCKSKDKDSRLSDILISTYCRFQ